MIVASGTVAGTQGRIRNFLIYIETKKVPSVEHQLLLIGSFLVGRLSRVVPSATMTIWRRSIRVYLRDNEKRRTFSRRYIGYGPVVVDTTSQVV